MLLLLIFAGWMNDLAASLETRAGLSDEDTYLKSLARKMPLRLSQSLSVSTGKKYDFYFKKFEQFMLDHDKPSLPAGSLLVSLFIVHLLEKKVSYSVICSHVYAIKRRHELYGFTDPTCSPHVKQLLSTSKRSSPKGGGKKDVILPEYIVDLFTMYTDSEDVYVLRDLAMIIVCYAGFLRYDELSNIKCKMSFLKRIMSK